MKIKKKGGGGGGGDLVIRLKKVGSSYVVSRGVGKPISGGITKPKNKVRKPRAVRFSLDSVTFLGATAIHYARIPMQGPGGHPSYIRSGLELPRHHFTPAVVRPAAGQPHWINDDNHPLSWPAAYVRDGAGGGPHARGLQATFSATQNFNGQRLIRATGPNGIATNAVVVTFVLGVAAANFTFQTLPNTVGCLSGIDLVWETSPVGAVVFNELERSRHTLYLLDAASNAALGAGEQYYFELVDWSCRWAQGQAGAANVLAQILARFQPVAANHASGLIYWRNHNAGVAPAQSLARAIQYQDHGIGERKASSCKVFDYVFLNCLALHGIQAAEIQLDPAAYLTPLAPVPPLVIPPLPTTGFLGTNPNTGLFSLYINPNSWAATTVVAHGNPGAPDGWSNHWVAAVNTGVGMTGWQLYDPSYGLGPFNLAAAPGVPGNALAIPAAYDAAGVLHFTCVAWSDDGINIALRFDNLPSANPNPPHLVGTVLTIN